MPVELDPALFPADPGLVVLDVGPGAGGMSEQLARDRPVVTIEIDPALAKEVAARRDTPYRLTSCCGDAHRMPVRDASVDGVTALEVLEHVDDPDGVLAEAYRVLKPGGALCVAVPTSYTEAFYSRVHPRYMSNATHVRIFKKDDLLRRVERAGFDVVRVKPEHLEPAIAWVVHSFLRSDATPTGWVLEHQSVDPRVGRVVAGVARTRGVGRVVPWARRRLGKSWYVYARKTRSPGG